MLLAIEDAAGEGVDGLCLVTLGLVVAYELEVHSSLYGRGVEGLRMYFRVNMVFGREVYRKFVLSDSP